MRLTKVTLTGADDSIEPIKLFELSSKYPFVEWGILLSRNSQGQNRFPSKDWLQELQHLMDRPDLHPNPIIHLSGHLCGAYVRELLLGIDDFIPKDITYDVWNIFERIQVNTHGVKHPYNDFRMMRILELCPRKEFIFQFDNANDHLLGFVQGSGGKTSFLFDLSHGAGIAPSTWPEAIPGIACGYAGGLSPDNVEGHLQQLCSRVPYYSDNEQNKQKDFWIDMETHIRSDNDKTFDLHKVNIVLDKCKRFVQS